MLITEKTQTEPNKLQQITLTPEGIARMLSNIPMDGSSWLIPNWRYTYRHMKYDLINTLKYDVGWQKISSNTEAIKQIKEWRDTTSNWQKIIETDDVAMFPLCLKKMKQYYMVNMDKEYCETVNRLSWQAKKNHHGNGQLYHRILNDFKAEYGVFRFRCVIGDNLYKVLRRHLVVTDDEFTSTYGNRLLDDSDCCDELLIEMLVRGRLSGAVRSYKIEGEFFG